MERFTKEELEKWWHAQCPKCGWDGLSRDCAGGEPIADTGDFGDPLCPMCIKKDDYVVVDDYAEPDAQATIAALQKEIATRDSTDSILATRIRELEARLTQRTAELEAAKAELEQERVRLASCLIAAEGGTKDIVKQGDYGWSPAYQATLNLQAELERVTGERDQLLTCQCEGCDESLEGSAYCERCFAKLRALILALPKVEGA